jgi:KDO2-lipid IV(A) lauroyltransferase
MINKWLSYVAAFFLYLVSLFPLRLLYLLSDFAFIIIFYVVKYRRNVVRMNLTNAFPEKSIEEIKGIEKRFFRYLSDLIFEVIKMLSVSEKEALKRFTFTNLDLLKKLEDQNKSYLFAVGHYGNWEWCTIVTPLIIKGKPLIIYKPLNNNVFNEVFKKAREKSGTLMVRMKMTLREMARFKNQLTVTVFAADQTPALADPHEWIKFLNQPTAIFMGIEKIARSTNYPVVFCDVDSVKRGYYSCDFKLVHDNPTTSEDKEITLKHAKFLEDRIKQKPEFWLWSHKRWKFKPAANTIIHELS